MASLAAAVDGLAQAGWADRVRSALAADRRGRPPFSASWVIPYPPPDAELATSYRVDGSEVRLYRLPGGTESLYFVAPGEYALPTAHVRLVPLARGELSRTPPPRVRLDRVEDVREYAARFAERAIPRLAAAHGGALGRGRAEGGATVRRLAAILAAYTAGLGGVEIPLRGPNVQDG